MKSPRRTLETCLYAEDLAAAKSFYAEVLGGEPFFEEAGRHVFFRIGESLLFIFNPHVSAHPTPPGEGIPVPTHGAHGPGHVAFQVEEDLDRWREHLLARKVEIERVIEWPGGGRSVYFRDPAGNSVELADTGLWADILAQAAQHDPASSRSRATHGRTVQHG